MAQILTFLFIATQQGHAVTGKSDHWGTLLALYCIAAMALAEHLGPDR